MKKGAGYGKARPSDHGIVRCVKTSCDSAVLTPLLFIHDVVGLFDKFID